MHSIRVPLISWNMLHAGLRRFPSSRRVDLAQEKRRAHSSSRRKTHRARKDASERRVKFCARVSLAYCVSWNDVHFGDLGDAIYEHSIPQSKLETPQTNNY